MRGLLAVPYSEAARGSSPERKKNHPLGSAQHHLPCDDEDEDDDGDDDLICISSCAVQICCTRSRLSIQFIMK